MRSLFISSITDNCAPADVITIFRMTFYSYNHIQSVMNAASAALPLHSQLIRAEASAGSFGIHADEFQLTTMCTLLNSFSESLRFMHLVRIQVRFRNFSIFSEQRHVSEPVPQWLPLRNAIT